LKPPIRRGIEVIVGVKTAHGVSMQGGIDELLIKLFASLCQSRSWEQKNSRKRLQEKYNVTIGYDTVWKGEREGHG
jgi:hypothetical protein